MKENEVNLDWLILNHGEFLRRFGISQEKIINEYSDWLKNATENSVVDYLLSLLREAGLFIIKKADTEEEYYNWRLELDTKMWECIVEFKKRDSNFWLQQIHLDKLLISRLTLPFKFDIQIDSTECCTYCSKKNKPVITFEKAVEKKYLPFTKCKRENGCSCSYSIIPLHDENGKLIPKDVWL